MLLKIDLSPESVAQTQTNFKPGTLSPSQVKTVKDRCKAPSIHMHFPYHRLVCLSHEGRSENS